MKSCLLIAVALAAFATPVMALNVTNLDNVPHRVELAGQGAPEVHEIAPGATEYFYGTTGGYLSLLSAQQPKKSKGSIHSDGLLSGIVGAARTENIPADPDNNYVIWPEGKLMLQNRVKRTNRK
ncbi:MAG: hypothetical protein V4735_02945 [Pseudomonadota bacterium]